MWFLIAPRRWNYRQSDCIEMTSKNNPRKIVDSRGIWCPPTPLTDLFKAYRTANTGDEIELWANEPDTEKDVRAWAKKSGNDVLEVDREKDYVKVVVKITRKARKKLERIMATKISLAKPDEIKILPKTKLEIVTVSGFTFGRRTFQPGWMWSTSIKPVAKTKSCEVHHIGYVISGKMLFAMDDGTNLTVGPGDAFDVKPGHDAWTVDEEPVVMIDLIDAVQA